MPCCSSTSCSSAGACRSNLKSYPRRQYHHLAEITGIPDHPGHHGFRRRNTPCPYLSPARNTPTLYTEQDFPPEVENAVSDFISGKTADTINGYLRWESVRARTDAAGKARIQEQIHRINYALYNTSLKENVSVFVGITREQAKRVRNESVFSESGYLLASSDPSVIYHRMADTGRDSDGYFTMCVIDFRKGNHVLFVNATEREFLLPQGGIWDVAREDTYQELEYSIDSIPRYDDTVPTKVRLIYTREHP